MKFASIPFVASTTWKRATSSLSVAETAITALLTVLLTKLALTITGFSSSPLVHSVPYTSNSNNFIPQPVAALVLQKRT